jgi:hypothetical protein
LLRSNFRELFETALLFVDAAPTPASNAIAYPAAPEREVGSARGPGV